MARRFARCGRIRHAVTIRPPSAASPSPPHAPTPTNAPAATYALTSIGISAPKKPPKNTARIAVGGDGRPRVAQATSHATPVPTRRSPGCPPGCVRPPRETSSRFRGGRSHAPVPACSARSPRVISRRSHTARRRLKEGGWWPCARLITSVVPRPGQFPRPLPDPFPPAAGWFPIAPCTPSPASRAAPRPRMAELAACGMLDRERVAGLMTEPCCSRASPESFGEGQI